MSITQQEALDYFRKHAKDWRSKAEGLRGPEVNVIEQRNRFALQVAEETPSMRTFLDVGCGTGELVCDVARRGVDSIGVDYAQEMIDLAKQKALDGAVRQATFVCSSIFDFEIRRKSYDLISANGFIEYISQPELNTFFDIVADALVPGGSFVVGSRNRLFNAVSMNEFTVHECENGDIVPLIGEVVAWNAAGKVADVTNVECAPLQAPMTEHKMTGIDVATRFQYTPLQLINLLQARGLRAVEVYPVHIHGASPAFCRVNAELHVSIANLLQEHARNNTQLLAQASTFMLHVRKLG